MGVPLEVLFQQLPRILCQLAEIFQHDLFVLLPTLLASEYPIDEKIRQDKLIAPGLCLAVGRRALVVVYVGQSETLQEFARRVGRRSGFLQLGLESKLINIVYGLVHVKVQHRGVVRDVEGTIQSTEPVDDLVHVAGKERPVVGYSIGAICDPMPHAVGERGDVVDQGAKSAILQRKEIVFFYVLPAPVIGYILGQRGCLIDVMDESCVGESLGQFAVVVFRVLDSIKAQPVI